MPPKCHYCNEELDYEGLIDHMSDRDYRYDTCWGHCPKCARVFTWDKVFNFSHCDNLKEVKELE